MKAGKPTRGPQPRNPLLNPTAPKEPVAERVRRMHREICDKLLEEMNELFTTSGYGKLSLELAFEKGVPQDNHLITVARRYKSAAA